MDSDEEFNPLRGGSPVPLDDMFDDEETADKLALKEVGKRRGGGSAKAKEISALRGANGYLWEDEYQRTWDIGTDGDDKQLLEHMIRGMIEQRKKKILKDSTPFQRGIIRTLIVVIDGSLIMAEKDLRPTRFAMTLQYLTDFVTEFFDQNPILQMGMVLMRNGVSTLISEVNGLPQYHLEKIRQLKARQHNRFEPKGDPLLQNALEMARSMLKYTYGGASELKNSKEVLVIFGALFTSDPRDIHKTIDSLVKDDIKCRVIGLLAQVAICQELVAKTNRDAAYEKNYGIIMNESHFKELLMDCVIPLPISEDEKRRQEHQTAESLGVPILRMGFPSKSQPHLGVPLSNSQFSIDFPVLNASHPTQGSEALKPVVLVQAAAQVDTTTGSGYDGSTTSLVGYQCPQCKNRVVNLPTICPVCGLMLILSTHLARLYHHLLPLAPYDDVPVDTSYELTHCAGCLLEFPASLATADDALSLRYRCKKCNGDYCIDCDVFIHETLHNCPGCENRIIY